MGKLKRIIAAALSLTLCLGTAALPASAATSDETRDDNIALSRKVATEGMVLLENNNESLPLKSGEKIAIFGEGQINFVKGGGGSGDVTAPYIRNVLEGFEIKENEGKVSIYKEIADKYKANAGYMPSDTVTRQAAIACDSAIVVISRRSGEGSDRRATEGDYYLSNTERTLLTRVCNAGFSDITVVLNIGGVMDTSWIAEYPAIRSVLLAWQPGMEGGLAVADVLCGDVNPSGKLTDTFAKNYNDYPSSAGFDNYWDHEDYTEDIYVGYRWFETFDPNYEKVNYEFGYGLSYTNFRLSNVKVTNDGKNINVSADVRNTGSVAGKEVVQVYFSAPQGKLGKPGKELAAYAKTGLIESGKSETVTMSFPISDMSSYDDTGKVQKSAYVLEKGTYNIYVGNSVRNAGERGVAGTYEADKDVITEQLTEEVSPTQLEKRLLADGSYEELETYENMDLDYFLPVADSGVTQIEAEDFYFKHCHAKVAFNSDCTQCGLDVLTSDAGNRWFVFALDVKAAGNYKLSLGLGNEKGKLTDSIKVWVDDVAQNIAKLGFPATGGIWNIQEVGSVTVNLPEGKHFLKIEFKDGDNYRGVFDYIKLEPGTGEVIVPDNSITVSGDSVNKIEGEKFSDSTSGIKTETITAGDSVGGTCVIGLDQHNIYTEYTLKVEKAGTYNLVFNAANGYGSDHNDSVDVFVNGTKQSGVVVNLPNKTTEGNQWYNFVNTEPVQITLPAGIVTLKFNYRGFGNLDYFTLTHSDVTVASASAKQTPALAAAKAGKISFADLYEDRSLMKDFIAQLTDEQLVDLLHGHGTTVAGAEGGIGNIPDYDVPAAETCDGPAGINYAEAATAWPIGTLVACTWNDALVEEMGAAFGKEAAENGIDILLTPGMNIHRNPLCGRNFEYYSEDPLITGKTAAALTRGIQSQGVGATLKHFAANNREYERGYFDARMSERALREIYLRGFEIAVKEGDAWCIMSSYNRLNGFETAERYDLLTTILRGEWKYEGIVMSDWWNDEVIYKGIAAGDDVQMGPPGNPELAVNAIKAGVLTREEAEISAERVLNMIMKTNAVDRALLDPVSHTISADSATRIKATDYSWKHSAVGMEKCEDTDGGYSTTDTWQGRWLRYYVDVEKAGVYTIKARVAYPNNGGDIRVSADGIELNTIRNNGGSNGYQDWKTTSGVKIVLPAGRSDLRLDFLGGVNLNWIELEPVATGTDITVTAPENAVKPGESAAITIDGTADVTWSVKGAGSSSTAIDADGNLSIGGDETAAFVIVYATSKANPDVVGAVKVQIEYANDEPDPDDFILGDVDASGTVNVSDILSLKTLIMNNSWTEDQLKRGDINNDGTLTVGDMLSIKNIIMAG